MPLRPVTRARIGTRIHIFHHHSNDQEKQGSGLPDEAVGKFGMTGSGHRPLMKSDGSGGGKVGSGNKKAPLPVGSRAAANPCCCGAQAVSGLVLLPDRVGCLAEIIPLEECQRLPAWHDATTACRRLRENRAVARWRNMTLFRERDRDIPTPGTRQPHFARFFISPAPWRAIAGNCRSATFC